MKSAGWIGMALAAVLVMPLVAVALIAGGAIAPAAIASTSCGGPVAVTAGAWRPPMTGTYRITSTFGMRDELPDVGSARGCSATNRRRTNSERSVSSSWKPGGKSVRDVPESRHM